MNDFTIYFYTRVSKDSANSLKELFKKIKTESTLEKITIYISSTGGDVEAAFEICNFLQQEQMNANVSIVNVAIVGSAATIVFLSCDNRYTYEDSFFMFHEPYYENNLKYSDFIKTPNFDTTEKIYTLSEKYFNTIESRLNNSQRSLEIRNCIGAKDITLLGMDAPTYGIANIIPHPVKFTRDKVFAIY